MENTTFPRMHVSLYVKDVTETAYFYKKFFGTSPAKLRDDYCKFELEQPGLIISFVQNAEKVSAQFGHLGIQVGSEEDLQQRLAQTKSQQVEVLEEMGTNCCYAAQDKYWVSDPDGHMWEVYYFHKDVEFNDPRYATNEAPACCTPEQAAAPVKQKVSLSTLEPFKVYQKVEVVNPAPAVVDPYFMKILVLCTGNSCRSQMAEGWLRHFANQMEIDAEIVSAGVETHGLNPRAVKSMSDAGMDISGHKSELVDDFLGTGVTHVLSVCDHARESCPIFPEDVVKVHHTFPDPAKAEGTEEEIMEAFNAVRDAVSSYCHEFLRDLDQA